MKKVRQYAKFVAVGDRIQAEGRPALDTVLARRETPLLMALVTPTFTRWVPKWALVEVVRNS